MPREILDRELREMQEDMLALGGMVGQNLSEAVEILKRQDRAGAERLIAADRSLNERRFAIETDALILIATQQPMAIDLRIIAAVMTITSELERIGDYAKGIAKITLMIGDQPLLKPLIDVPLMAEKARSMLHRALEAFAQRDLIAARAIPEEDDEVDELYDQVYRELMTFIIADPANIDQANYLLWAAHNLERAADRVTNICERLVFAVTGRMEEMDVEEGPAPESAD